MSDDNDQDERHPYEVIEEKADQMGLEGEDRDDFIEAKMKRAGFKKGPGAWVAISDDDDDGDHDDDDTPMTRGDWRKMQREQKRRQRESYTPPRKKKSVEGGSGGNAGGERNGGKATRKDPWW